MQFFSAIPIRRKAVIGGAATWRQAATKGSGHFAPHAVLGMNTILPATLLAKTSPLQPEDVRRRRAYLRTRRDDAPALFLSSRGIPLECRSYWDLMQKDGERAGLPKAKRRFHALRHAIAVHLLDAGADVTFVQDRLGHANIQNTIISMRYYTTATRDAHTRHLFASPHVVEECPAGDPWLDVFLTSPPEFGSSALLVKRFPHSPWEAQETT